MLSKEELGKLALSCSQNLNNGQAFEKLCLAIKPIAYSVMKGHKNYIPYYDKDDYLQEAYLTLYRVLKRIAVKPDIADSFFPYLWVSIRNAYSTMFRNYVLHHLIEINSYEVREGGYNCSQMVYFQEYVDAFHAKRREYERIYYWSHRERILELKRQWRMNNLQRARETKRRYYWSHHEQIAEKRRLKREEIREYEKEYYWSHRERILELKRQWRMNNLQRARETERRYYWNHREQRAKRSRLKRENHSS